MTTQAIVYVVDDDPFIGVALTGLLRGAGYMARGFTSPSAFLAAFAPEVPGCVITELVMPEMSGLALQRALATYDYSPPVVFLTGRGDINSTVQAMKAGAVNFLCKPVQPEHFLAAVHEAVARDAKLRSNFERRRRVRGMLDELTPRERDVLGLVVQGLPNKATAGRLGRGQRTIKLHKQHLMEKMCVRSATALVQLLMEGDVALPPVRISGQSSPTRRRDRAARASDLCLIAGVSLSS